MANMLANISSGKAVCLPNAAAKYPLPLDLRALDQLQHHRPAVGSGSCNPGWTVFSYN